VRFIGGYYILEISPLKYPYANGFNLSNTVFPKVLQDTPEIPCGVFVEPTRKKVYALEG
jgi:hypothetical protein